MKALPIKPSVTKTSFRSRMPAILAALLLLVASATESFALNLALNKNISASSSEGGNPPQNAVDGNFGTRWSSDFSDPQWITVDLGTPASVNRVILHWEAAYGREYRIQGSMDGANFSDLLYIDNGDGGFDELAFSAAQARYVRVYGIQRGTPWGYSLYELEVYDDVAPSAPVVSVTSAWSTIENEARTISGTAEPDATVVPYVEVFGTAYEQTNVQADGGGQWTASVNIWGGDGTEFKVYASSRDAAGNWSGPSNEQTIRKDLFAPGAPAVNATSAWSTIENEARTISGTAEANAAVVPYVEVFGTAYEQTNVQADANGNWSASVNIWGGDGTEFKVYASSRDAAGNWSGKSNEQTIRKDLFAPGAPVVNATSAVSNIENEARTISGTVEANATVIPFVEVFGTAYEQTNVQAGGDGNWSASVNIWGPDGTEFNVYATARDAAGNWSGPSNEQTIRKDFTAPVMPILYPTSPWSTIENEVRTISGRAEPNATILPIVAVLGNGSFDQPRAQVDAGGSFVASVNLFGQDGTQFEITVKAMDAAGNISVVSNALTVSKDISAPAAPALDATSVWSNIEQEARTITGTVEPYATVVPFVEVVGIGTWEQTNVQADAMGAFSASANIWGPDASEFRIYAQARDAAGNTGARSAELTVRKDLVAPVISIDAVPSPTDQDVTLHYTAVDANPVTVTGDQSPYTAEGVYDVTLVATDAAGNSSSASVSFEIKRVPPDVLPPVTSISIDIMDDSGRVIPQSLVTLSVTDEPSDNASGVAATEIRFDDGFFMEYAGPFTFAGLSAGEHTLDVRSRDNAGNVEATRTQTVTVVDALGVTRNVNQDVAPNLLVWLNYREGHGSNSGKLFAEGHDEVDQALLDQVLAGSGAMSVTKVTSRKDFVSALRSGKHNAYLILGNRANSKSAGTYDEELRERVRRGESVIGSFWRSGRLADARVEGRSVWGAKVRDGRICKRDHLATFLGGKLVSDTVSVLSDGKTRKVELSEKDNSPDVSVVGIVNAGGCNGGHDAGEESDDDDEGGEDDAEPSDHDHSRCEGKSLAVSNVYFNGRSVYVPFDLGAALTADNAGAVAEVVKSAVSFAKPDVTAVVEGQTVTVALTVSSPVTELATRLVVTVPAGLTVTSVSTGGDLGTPGTIAWEQTIAAGASVTVTFTADVADGAAGALTFATTASYSVRGQTYSVSSSFIVPVEGGNVSDLVDGIVSEINALSVTSSWDARRKEKAAREVARIAGRDLSKLGQVKDALRNWKNTLYGDVLRIESADVSSVVQKMDVLMVVLERRFVTATPGNHGEVARR